MNKHAIKMISDSINFIEAMENKEWTLKEILEHSGYQDMKNLSLKTGFSSGFFRTLIRHERFWGKASKFLSAVTGFQEKTCMKAIENYMAGRNLERL